MTTLLKVRLVSMTPPVEHAERNIAANAAMSAANFPGEKFLMVRKCVSRSSRGVQRPVSSRAGRYRGS
jgi:hypothetical protein